LLERIANLTGIFGIDSAMNILVLTWEFPPQIVGGLSRHVAGLYPALARQGYKIHLLTLASEQTFHREIVDGIHVYRVPVAPAQYFLDWISNLNVSLQQYGHQLGQEVAGGFDLIHAHDWLVADAAIALKHSLQIPMIATIHSTEAGRNNGIHTPEQRYIHDKELRLATYASRLIVCTNFMRVEVERNLQANANLIDVIYNGIRPEQKQPLPPAEIDQFRRCFADDTEKIVYYVGRLTYEKGLTVLVEAAPKVIQAMRAIHQSVKFVIIGTGNSEELKFRVGQLGLWQQFYFTGFMSDQDLDKFQTIANCAVFPSLYEPFGIVALESFAAKVPVVVSNAGGLPEVVRHNHTGIVTGANDPESLAWGILQVLQCPDYGRELVENAYAELERRFDWEKIAEQTACVYHRILGDISTSLSGAAAVSV
jgi:glycosyltransferase involved in cell wall biosynthesis